MTETGHRRGIHRGWWVVLASALVFFVQSGVGSYLPGVMQPAWIDDFGWPATWITIPYSLGTLLPGLAGVHVGRWTDRYGPRRIVIIGAFLAGLSYVMLAAVDTFAMFLAVAVLSAIGRSGTSQVPASAAITRWFSAKRARAIGLATTGISLAGVILVPTATWLVYATGWRTTSIIMGVMIWVLIIPMAAVFMDKTPESRGLQPYGAGTVEPSRQRVAVVDETLAGAMRGMTFWLVAAGLMLGQSGSYAIGIHAQKAILDKGVSPAEAAGAISLLAGCALLGRFVQSWLGDRLPSALLLAASYGMQAVGFAMLGLSSAGPGVFVFAVVYGLGLGGSGALQATVVADLFGIRAYGAILGAIGLPAAVLSALTPLIAAAVHDLTGSYAAAFVSFAFVASSGSTALVIAYRQRMAARRTPVAAEQPGKP